MEELSEETANKLIKAFKCSYSPAKYTINYFSESIDNKLSIIETESVIKYAKLSIKVFNSSFITKLFWKIMLDKHKNKMKEFVSARNKLNI